MTFNIVENFDITKMRPFKEEDSSVVLHCPLVDVFAASDDLASLKSKVEKLQKICDRTTENLATSIVEEHIYKVDESDARIMVAGSGSIVRFRGNFGLRLAEVFRNLDWLYRFQRNDFSIDEFKAYRDIYRTWKSVTTKDLVTIELVERNLSDLEQKLGELER